MGKGVVTDTEARETLVITRKTSNGCSSFPSVSPNAARRAASRVS